jgi:hypothetical protein
MTRRDGAKLYEQILYWVCWIFMGLLALYALTKVFS